MKGGQKLSLVDEIRDLSLPKPGSPKYPSQKWSNLFQKISQQQVQNATENLNGRYRRMLLAYLALENDKKERLNDALNINAHHSACEGFVDRVRNRTYSTLRILPRTTACLVCSWISEINVYGRDYYTNNIRDSLGYYNPKEHYIDIASDSSNTSYEWPRNRDYETNEVEYSTTVHEIGHAIHYMNGIQLKNPETLDNRGTNKWKIGVKTNLELNKHQEEFFWKGVNGYVNLMKERYDGLRVSNYQEKNIEEMLAVAFEGWITSPNYLYKEQPVMWSAFANLQCTTPSTCSAH